MRSLITWLFHKVTYACTHCGARQRIPLRRVHFFERFHDLVHGEVVLIACPQCHEGVQIPTPYRSHTGQPVHLDPENPSNHVLHVS
jgi:uncharacterized protein YlaI